MKAMTMFLQYHHTFLLPRLLNVQHSIKQFYENIRNELHTLYDESIHHYRTIQCPILLLQQPVRSKVITTTASNNSATLGHNNNSNNVALQIIQYTCDYTHETILLFLKLVGSILVVLYHRSILHFCFYMILKILKIVYQYNPVRLVLVYGWFGRRRRRPSTPTTSVIITTTTTTNGHAASIITTEEDLYMDSHEMTK